MLAAPVHVLAAIAVLCAAAQALGISSKVDLPGAASPGIVKAHRPLGTDALSPELVQAVLNVNVKSARPDQGATNVNAIVCVNGASGKCGAKRPALRPALSIDSEEEGEEDSGDNQHHIAQGEEEQVSQEEGETANKLKPGIFYVDEDESEEKDTKKKKKKKIQDVPVIVGYAGLNVGDISSLNDKVHVSNGNGYDLDQSLRDVPVYTGLKLSSEFGKPHQTYSYLQQPPQREIPVTFKQVPFGFDESALVSHVFETSPLIRALHSAYNPSIHQSGHDTKFTVSSFNPRLAVYDIPDYVTGVQRPYHHAEPGFYGGIPPRAYPRPGVQRGIVRTGGAGCQYPTRGVWSPSPSPSIPTIEDKVAFDGDEEDTKPQPGALGDTDSPDGSNTPVVIKIDGKLGGPLEGLKT